MVAGRIAAESDHWLCRQRNRQQWNGRATGRVHRAGTRDSRQAWSESLHGFARAAGGGAAPRANAVAVDNHGAKLLFRSSFRRKERCAGSATERHRRAIRAGFGATTQGARYTEDIAAAKSD